MIVLNIATLSKRLETLLSWQAHVYALSEVRLSLSLSAQRSVARRASLLGFGSLLAPSPSLCGFCRPPGWSGFSCSETAVGEATEVSGAS